MITSQQSRRQRRRLASSVVMIAVLGATQFFLWRFVQGAAHQLQAKRTESEQLSTIRSRLEEMTRGQKTEQSLLEQLNTSFPDRSETPQAVERLERLADERQIKLEIRSIAEETSKKEQKKIIPLVVVVQASGRPAALLQYMDGVENVVELTQIRSWTLAPQAVAPSTGLLSPGTYTLDMEIVFYLQGQTDGGKK
jgi:hypothetical protein